MREIKFKIYNIAQFTQYKAQTYEFKEYVPYLRVFSVSTPSFYSLQYAEITWRLANGNWQTKYHQQDVLPCEVIPLTQYSTEAQL